MSLKEFSADSGTALADQAAPIPIEYMIVDADLIVESTTNPRSIFNIPRLQELAEDIKVRGVLQPILVRPIPASRLQDTSDHVAHGSKRAPRPIYEIIAGARRFRASALAGLKRLPVLIRSLTDAQVSDVLEMQLVENLHRDDLHPMEEAEGYERLCQTTGISKDDVGEKIGRSRGYIYARLKLLELTAKAREAFYEGKIDSSRALVIARIPDAQLQLKALEEATAADWQGARRHNFKSFVRWAQQNMMLRLDAARFKITDASLVPDAGSCRDCSKRTGAQPEVYADVESADVCTDPACYHAKDAAHEAIVLEKAREKGQQIILEKEAKQIWQWEHTPMKGFTRLDRPDARLTSNKALKTELGKSMPQPILMQNPHKRGELIEVLPTAQVTKLLKESGKLAPKPQSDTARQSQSPSVDTAKPVEERREYNNRWQAESLRQADAYFKGWTETVPAAVLRAFMLHMLDVVDEGSFGPALDLGTEFDTSDAFNRLNTLPDTAMPEVFIRWVLHDTEGGYPSPWTAEQRNKTEPKHPTWEILAIAGVDVDAIQLEVKQQIETDDRARQAAKEEAKAPSPPRSKKSSAPPAAQVPRAKKKSKEEVQLDIALAFQKLDQAPKGAEQEQAAEAAQGQDQAPDGADQEEGAAPAALASPSEVAWPFPTGATSKARVDVGVKVKVKETLAGTGGDHAGKEGVVSGQVVGEDRWQVKFPGRGGKASKIAEFDTDMLEVQA